MHWLVVLSCLFLLLSLATDAAAAPLEGGVDPNRVEQVATFLGDGPFTFGPKISDRAAWEKLAKHKQFANVVPKATKKLAEPMPAMTAELYAQYKKTGKRTKEYGDVRSNRHGRIAIYTLAECVENKGRFIAPLEAVIADICTEPTWIFNFHDTDKLDNWNEKQLKVDLGSILPAHDMAAAMVLLGDRLSPEARKLITDNCRKRILDPYRNAVDNGGDKGMWWINARMNWNSVCHYGVVGTALGVIDDKKERAYYVAAAEKFSGLYLQGFGPDGYCDEGMGYWNYGFSNYVGLCELILQATGGKVDLFELPNARAAAMYPAHIEMQNGLSASFADCALNSKPEARLATFVNRHYGLGLPQFHEADLTWVSPSIYQTLMLSTPNSATQAPPAKKTAGYELRSYFDHGGVLTSRPALGSSCRMAVSLKGGHNAEAHNHNDLGTFVVGVGKELLILDPGGEVYTSRTFSKDRYQSNLLNSFGHPVPVIAGKLQRPGKDAKAKILQADFTDRADTFAIDISSAYEVPELKKLTRTFVYNRTGQGSLVVTDDFAFSSPQTYATAILTYGQWKKKGDRAIVISKGVEAVEVSIDTAGVAFDIVDQVINEQTHNGEKPTRIGINLKQPIAGGKVTMIIQPVETTP